MQEIIQKRNQGKLICSESFNFLWKIDGRYRRTSFGSYSSEGPSSRYGACAAMQRRRSAQRRATGWRRRGAGALPSRSPGHRSSPAALAGCRCLARRALREVPKCLRASYTRATIDRAASPNSEILGKTVLPFLYHHPPSRSSFTSLRDL